MVLGLKMMDDNKVQGMMGGQEGAGGGWERSGNGEARKWEGSCGWLLKSPSILTGSVSESGREPEALP